MTEHDRWHGYWQSDAPFHVEQRDGPSRPAQIIVVANQKGGVGKTTTAISVASALAQQSIRVLLVDSDPQANCTSGVGMRLPEEHPSIYDVLNDGMDAMRVIEATNQKNLWLLPSSIDLAGAEIELVSALSREQQLRRALEPTREHFDIVIIDCPPSLGLLTINALSAADGVVVPIQCEYYALEGLGALTRNAELVRQNLNPGLKITGFALTMYDGRTKLSHEVANEVRRHFGDLVFQTRIPRSVRLAEAPSYGQPITIFDPSSRGAVAYHRLAGEIWERVLFNEAVARRSS
ncbi:MAG TPA: AAA family ATPase [Euzebyales bacterium]|nr:AAA family ATPase [Euzebyales bacterium]